jgi:N-acetylglutamate synthase-like GNAT family acetyltransferase
VFPGWADHKEWFEKREFKEYEQDNLDADK